MRRFLLPALAGWWMLPGLLGAEETMAPEIVVSARDCHESAPDVAYDSSRDLYLVVWYEVCPTPATTRRVLARRLHSDGHPVDGFDWDIRGSAGDLVGARRLVGGLRGSAPAVRRRRG